MSQYRVTLRGQLPIEVDVIVEGDNINEAKLNATYSDEWIGNPKVYSISWGDKAANELECWTSDIESIDLTLTNDKVSKILKADEVEI